MKNTEFALFTPSAFSTMLEVIICPALLVASDNKTVQDLLLRVLLKPVQRLFNRGEEGLTHSSAMGNPICV
jgi:hypothetical protein